MLQLLDATISLNSLIWLYLVAFMLHDFEEIIRIEPWFRKHKETIYSRIPKRFQKDFKHLSSVTSSQFAVAVCIEFIVFIPVTFLAAEQGKLLLFIGFNVIMFLHVFMHIAQALYLRMVVPGVATALLITFPYSAYLFYRLLKENLIEISDIFLSIPLGLLLLPILLLGHKAGRSLYPN